MRLLDLDPHWLMENGVKEGFAFQSPINPKWYQTCFFKPGRKLICCSDPVCFQNLDKADCLHSQAGLIKAAGLDPNWFQGCKTNCGWTVHGELDFATLTVTPSLDGSAGGLWHGFITDGNIVGGLP